MLVQGFAEPPASWFVPTFGGLGQAECLDERLSTSTWQFPAVTDCQHVGATRTKEEHGPDYHHEWTWHVDPSLRISKSRLIIRIQYQLEVLAGLNDVCHWSFHWGLDRRSLGTFYVCTWLQKRFTLQLGFGLGFPFLTTRHSSGLQANRNLWLSACVGVTRNSS